MAGGGAQAHLIPVPGLGAGGQISFGSVSSALWRQGSGDYRSDRRQRVPARARHGATAQPALRPSRRAWADGGQTRLRRGRVRRLHRPPRRAARAGLPGARVCGRRPRRHHRRGARDRRPAAPGAARLRRGRGAPVRLLHRRDDHEHGRAARSGCRSRRRPDPGRSWRATSAAAARIHASCGPSTGRPSWRPGPRRGRRRRAWRNRRRRAASSAGGRRAGGGRGRSGTIPACRTRDPGT